MKALLVAVAVAGLAAPANAVVVFSEDFNAAGFVGETIDRGDRSDRFGSTDYSLINDFNGWTFGSSGTLLAQPSGGSDGAVLLNEGSPGGSATRTVTGLTAGRTYRLGFLLSGDNEAGQPYVLDVAVDGAPAATFTGVDGEAGTVTGSFEHLFFVAAGSSAVLNFSQASETSASPIIDDVTVGTVPEPAAWSMMIGGFALVGVAARRRPAPSRVRPG